MPAGDASSSYHKLNKKLEEVGIFMVQEGELESFVKQVGGHGPDWTNTVLETYPDLEDDVYKK